MGTTKDKYIEAQSKDPKNWITRKCVICETPVKINKALDGRLADWSEPFTCKKCLNKE